MNDVLYLLAVPLMVLVASLLLAWHVNRVDGAKTSRPKP
jgi:hypothetical protein